MIITTRIKGLTISVSNYGSSCVQPCGGGGKPPFFDGTCYDYWKRKMKMYLGSINDQVWDVTKSDYVILDPTNLTKTRPTSNATQWLSTPSIIPLIPRCLSKSRIVIELMRCG